MAGLISNPHVEAPRNDPWTLWREAAVLSNAGYDKLAAANLKTIIDHPGTPADLRKLAVEQSEALARPRPPAAGKAGDDLIPF
jgi:hypothetical protein